MNEADRLKSDFESVKKETKSMKLNYESVLDNTRELELVSNKIYFYINF